MWSRRWLSVRALLAHGAWLAARDCSQPAGRRVQRRELACRAASVSCVCAGLTRVNAGAWQPRGSGRSAGARARLAARKTRAEHAVMRRARELEAGVAAAETSVFASEMGVFALETRCCCLWKGVVAPPSARGRVRPAAGAIAAPSGVGGLCVCACASPARSAQRLAESPAARASPRAAARAGFKQGMRTVVMRKGTGGPVGYERTIGSRKTRGESVRCAAWGRSPARGLQGRRVPQGRAGHTASGARQAVVTPEGRSGGGWYRWGGALAGLTSPAARARRRIGVRLTNNKRGGRRTERDQALQYVPQQGYNLHPLLKR